MIVYRLSYAKKDEPMKCPVCSKRISKICTTCGFNSSIDPINRRTLCELSEQDAATYFQTFQSAEEKIAEAPVLSTSVPVEIKPPKEAVEKKISSGTPGKKKSSSPAKTTDSAPKKKKSCLPILLIVLGVFIYFKFIHKDETPNSAPSSTAPVLEQETINISGKEEESLESTYHAQLEDLLLRFEEGINLNGKHYSQVSTEEYYEYLKDNHFYIKKGTSDNHQGTAYYQSTIDSSSMEGIAKNIIYWNTIIDYGDSSYIDQNHTVHWAYNPAFHNFEEDETVGQLTDIMNQYVPHPLNLSLGDDIDTCFSKLNISDDCIEWLGFTNDVSGPSLSSKQRSWDDSTGNHWYAKITYDDTNSSYELSLRGYPYKLTLFFTKQESEQYVFTAAVFNY